MSSVAQSQKNFTKRILKKIKQTEYNSKLQVYVLVVEWEGSKGEEIIALPDLIFGSLCHVPQKNLNHLLSVTQEITMTTYWTNSESGEVYDQEQRDEVSKISFAPETKQFLSKGVIVKEEDSAGLDI